MKPMHPRKRLQKIINQCSQMIRDGSYWNSINPEEEPLDLEPERVLLSLAKEAATLWDSGQIKQSFAVGERMYVYAERTQQERGQ